MRYILEEERKEQEGEEMNQLLSVKHTTGDRLMEAGDPN